MTELDPPPPIHASGRATGFRALVLLVELLVTVALGGGLYGITAFPIPDESVMAMSHADWSREGFRKALNTSPFTLIWFAVTYPVNLATLGRGGGIRALAISVAMSLIILTAIVIGALEFVRARPHM